MTFLSTPGQAYADGMRFMQFYLGLPLAMIVLGVLLAAAVSAAAGDRREPRRNPPSAALAYADLPQM